MAALSMKRYEKYRFSTLRYRGGTWSSTWDTKQHINQLVTDWFTR